MSSFGCDSVSNWMLKKVAIKLKGKKKRIKKMKKNCLDSWWEVKRAMGWVGLLYTILYYPKVCNILKLYYYRFHPWPSTVFFVTTKSLFYLHNKVILTHSYTHTNISICRMYTHNACREKTEEIYIKTFCCYLKRHCGKNYIIQYNVIKCTVFQESPETNG